MQSEVFAPRLSTTKLHEKETYINKTALLFLGLLLTGDLVFIILHQVVVYTPILQASVYLLNTDRGMAEFYQYLKFIWIITLFTVYFFQTKKPILIFWLFLFIFLLLDDSISIHEKLGTYISNQLNFVPMFLLRAQDFGELAVTGVIGFIILSILGFLFFRLSPDYKRISLDLLFLLGILVFFGVVVDMLHVMIKKTYGFNNLFNTIEDGGEMVAVSLICWYVVSLFEFIFKHKPHFVSPLQVIIKFFRKRRLNI